MIYMNVVLPSSWPWGEGLNFLSSVWLTTLVLSVAAVLDVEIGVGEGVEEMDFVVVGKLVTMAPALLVHRIEY